MLWLGLALSLAGGASIHSQTAAVPVGPEQVVVAESTGSPSSVQVVEGAGGGGIPACLQPADVQTVDGGIGPPRSSDVQTVDGGIGPPRSTQVLTADGGIGPPFRG